MKRTSVTAAVVLAIVVGALAAGHLVFASGQGADKEPAPSGARAAEEVRTIESEGTAFVRVKPDRARLYFKVTTQAETAKEARTANGTQAKKAMQAIQDLKIADMKMKTSNVEVEPVYALDAKMDTLPKVLGYRVAHTFTILLANDDTDKLAGDAGRVLNVALDNGANEAEGIVFFKEDTTASRREAMTKATEDALANCRALAKGADRTIIDVVSIKDLGRPSGNIYMQQGGGRVRGDEENTALIAADLVIVWRVSMVCRLGPAK